MKKLIIAVLLCLIVAGSGVFLHYEAQPVGAEGVTITTTTETYTSLGGMTCRSRQRHMFYAEGRYWLFFYHGYGTGNGFKYTSSADAGATWAVPVLWRCWSLTANEADEFSVWFDGTYVHYVYCLNRAYASSDLVYRMGDPNADGTITWVDSEQIVWDNTADGSNPMGGPMMVYPYITTDVNGYPWIVADAWYNPDGMISYVSKSSTKDGTWTHAAGFPYDVGAQMQGNILVALSDGDVSVISAYGIANTWDAATSTWSGQDTGGEGWGWRWGSAIADSDDTIWCVSSYPGRTSLIVQKYDPVLGWLPSETIATGIGSNTAPVIAYNSNFDTLTIVWARSDTDEVWSIRRVDGIWDNAPMLLTTEGTDGIYSPSMKNSDGMITIMPEAASDNFCMAYVCGTDASIKLKALVITDTAGVGGTPATTFSTLGYVVATGTYYRARSDIDSVFYMEDLYWVFYERGFRYKVSADNLNWSVERSAMGSQVNDDWYYINYTYDGTYLHAVYVLNSDVNNPIYYRRGTPSATGVITWTAQQTAVAAVADEKSHYVDIAVDSSGYPYISYYRDDWGDSSATGGYISKSSTNDGTWVTDAGYPLLVNAAGAPIIVALESDQEMVAALGQTGTYGKYYTTAGGWSDNQTAFDVGATTGCYLSASLAAYGQTVYAAWCDGNDVNAAYWTEAAGWSASIELKDGSSNAYRPTVSIDENGNVYVFWQESNYIYYRVRSAGTGIWASQQVAVYKSGILSSVTPRTIKNFVDGHTMVIYQLTGTMYLFAEILPTATVTTKAASSIKVDKATFSGLVTYDGEDECQYRFQYGENTTSGWETDWAGELESGDVFSRAVGSLSVDTSYYARAQVKNDHGVFQGEWVEFDTLSEVGAPSGLLVTAYEDSLVLSWAAGAGADYTVIRYSLTGYPATMTEGSGITVSTASYQLLSTLPGTTYYFSLWGYYTTTWYSASYITGIATTSPGVVESVFGPSEDLNPIVPDDSALASMPGYGLLSWWAGALDISIGFALRIVGIFILAIISGGLAVRTESMILTAFATMGMMACTLNMGILPMAIVFVYGVIVVSIAYIKGAQSYG